MSRLVVANLDCEVAFAGAGGRPLPERVLRFASQAALWLAELARPGDRLWTPRRVVPARAPPDLEGIELVSGPLSAAAPAAHVLAWGETAEIAALRAAAPGRTAEVGPGASLLDLLWSVHPSPATARAANDRGFALAIAAARGWHHPESRFVGSLSELEAHLAGGDRWVLKAPFSAAGRERVFLRAPELDPPARARVERLLSRHRRLLVEPWVERVSDFGVAGVVTPEGARLLPPHRQEVDRAGVVRAVEVGVELEAAREAGEAAAAAAGALRAAGYLGPFSIEGYLYRRGGGLEVHRISEVNARLTFGVVAHAAAERRGAERFRLELPRPSTS